MNFYISGIQQIGIGVRNVHKAYHWYNTVLGFNVKIFEEAAEAALMLPYTGGKPQNRHAILALNIQGGGGFEIWQYTERTPAAPIQPVIPGDLGWYAGMLKTPDIRSAHLHLQKADVRLSEIYNGFHVAYFYFFDPFGNPFKVVEFKECFRRSGHALAGVCGAVAGVSHLERSVDFYKRVLGFTEESANGFSDESEMKFLCGEGVRVRKKLLFKPNSGKGPFAPVLGSNFVELWQAEGRTPSKIFEGRQWGDLGFIHLCFDVVGMRNLELHCYKNGHAFTVDGGEGFEMGEAAGHFTYIEDPDGSLIEFVETKKIPLIKKIRWYLDLRKREPGKPLPLWMLKAMGWNKDVIR